MMDYEPNYGTSLASTKSPSQMRSKNTFQQELDAKMRHRRSMGLTADLTTEDESDDDGLGSDDELLSGFNMTSKPRRQDRPGSAKRREDPMARTYGGASGGATGGWEPPGAKSRTSPRFDPKSPTSDGLLAEDILSSQKKSYMKSSKAQAGKGPKEEEERPLTKQEIIFGRKSPREADRRSPQPRGNFDESGKWQPPSFRKAAPEDLERDARRSPASFGRKTPDHLESISESPKPQPRKRGGKYGELDDSSRHHLRPLATSQATSQAAPRPLPQPRSVHKKVDDDVSFSSGRPQPKPRGTIKEEKASERQPKGHEKTTTPKPQKRGTPDIFGTGRKTPNYLLDSDESDEELTKSKKSYSKTSTKESEGRKTPTGKKTPTGRLTPTGRQTPTDRKTPTGRHGSPVPTAAARKGVGHQDVKGRAQSPKGRAQSPKGRNDEVDEPKRQSSVLDFLMEKDKPKDDKDTRTGHRRADSKDSISSELMRARRESPLKDIINRRTPSPKGRMSPTKERVTPKERQSFSKDRKSPVIERITAQEQHATFSARPMTPEREVHAATRGRPMARGKSEERESSLCRDIDHDPEYQAHKEKYKEGERQQKKKTQAPQSREHQKIGDAIEQVADLNEETSRTMRYIEPEDEAAEKKSTETQKPLSATMTKKVRPQARYAKPQIEPDTQKSERSYDSTASIRQSIFNDWYSQKMDRSKQELIEKKKKEKEEEEKKKKDKEEKVTESKLAFRAWEEQKKEYLDKKFREKKRKEKEEREKKQEEEGKKTEAVLAFKSWKQNKDAVIKEKLSKEKQEQRKKEREEARKKEEKLRESKKVQEKWHEKKEYVLTSKEKKEREAKRESKRREAEEKRQKEEEAMESYEKWMENKVVKQDREEQERRRSGTRRHDMSTESLDERAPWSPAGRTIPFGRA
ncbi:trichohyalin-like isoform X2 [Lineus longissimus]|uniref:trichohyalin-like isoform X2 n=1 Tax=Lineus longissimus TaxID=88925 RepID=UPI00315C814D